MVAPRTRRAARRGKKHARLLAARDRPCPDEGKAAGAGALAGALSRLEPSPDFEEAVREAWSAVRRAARRAFGPRAEVRAFGSLLQGAHLQGSDLDLCIDFPPEVSLSRRNRNASGNEKQANALRRLLKVLPPAFSVKEERLFRHIRVPIVILGYDSTSGETVETDVSVGFTDERVGVEKGFTDRLIRRALSSASPRALHLVRLVKQWAKVEGLTKAFEGYLNSLGWTLLCLFFLMGRGELVPGLLYEDDEEDEDARPGVPPPLHCDGSGHDMPGSADLAAFFGMVAGYERWLDKDLESMWGLSLVSGKLIRRPTGEESPFYIEDPGVKIATGQSENVARALREHTWRSICARCRRAAETLQADSAVSAWAESLAVSRERATSPRVVIDQSVTDRKRAWHDSELEELPTKRPRYTIIEDECQTWRRRDVARDEFPRKRHGAKRKQLGRCPW
eukprot:gnl/TRDRNA2_/TRDRNA2_82531_c0_seq1.p1 gnl/TRDRNA2_/TRDRNA2_82531_c0~~gnl/TRDRNA2_/TRDRNA2_82531_c0_seq1.p1  ORF type:complete len:451 (-),score=56.68 gnl/TRDRNA2_/TRDRNA2_82531_c0_seq1:39-1391(-)